MANIGFIGLGNMGHPMAGRLRNAGHQLIVQDLRFEHAARFAGAEAVRTPKEVADRADIVLLSLPTPGAVRAVTLEDDGLVRGARAKLVVDLSTTGPKLAAEVAAALGRKDVQFIDAPVSGGVSGAEKGTLAIMASGPKDAFERAQPSLSALGRLFYVGEKPGQGQAMKLLNNLLSATAMAVTAEAMVLGVKAGLDPKVMLDVLNAGSGRNTATTDKFPRSVLDRSFNFGFRAVLLHKDVRLCKEFADALGVSFDVGSAVDKVWERAAKELADGDFTRIVELVERSAGVTVKGEK